MDLLRHPSATTFPPVCPSDGHRGDRHGYAGVQLKVWIAADATVHSALYVPAGSSQADERDALGALRGQLEAWTPSRVRPPARRHDLDEHEDITELDVGVELADEAPLWGPGFGRSGALAGTRGLPQADLVALALHDVRARLQQERRAD